MGLVQRVLKASGIATVSLSMIPAFTAAVGVPRLAAIAHPMSRPMGRPHDAEGQRAVLRAALEVLETASAPEPWWNCRSPGPTAKARKDAHVNPPISQLLVCKPWLIPRLMSGDIPDET